MKRTAILAAAGLLAAWTSSGQDFLFNPEKSSTGSVVRITALRPPISLNRALVVQCASNSITVRRDRDTFVVQSSNVLEFALLEAAPPPPVLVTNESGKVVAMDAKAAAEANKKSLWDRVVGFFKR